MQNHIIDSENKIFPYKTINRNVFKAFLSNKKICETAL